MNSKTLVSSHNSHERIIKKVSGFIPKTVTIFQGLFTDDTLDFQGPPIATRNIFHKIVQTCTFPVYSYKALRLELFASPTSLHFSVHMSYAS